MKNHQGEDPYGRRARRCCWCQLQLGGNIPLFFLFFFGFLPPDDFSLLERRRQKEKKKNRLTSREILSSKHHLKVFFFSPSVWYCKLKDILKIFFTLMLKYRYIFATFFQCWFKFLQNLSDKRRAPKLLLYRRNTSRFQVDSLKVTTDS